MNATIIYRHAGRCSDPFYKEMTKVKIYTETHRPFCSQILLDLNAVVICKHCVLALSKHEQDRQTALP